MTPMEYKGYIGSTEIDFENNSLHGKLLFLKDVITYEADSVSNLQTRFHEAVDEYLALCNEFGDIPDTPCKGSFNVRIGPDLHKKCAIAATKESISLNDWVKRACEEKLATSKDTTLLGSIHNKVFNIATNIEEEEVQFETSDSTSIGAAWQPLQFH